LPNNNHVNGQNYRHCQSKGGVGKTTTAVNLSASLAVAEKRHAARRRADPQERATSGVGLSKGELDASLYDVMVDGRDPDEVIARDVGIPFLDVLPATQDLVGAELELVNRVERETALRADSRAFAIAMTSSSSTVHRRSAC
jgi:chromosome partitioning protein